MFSHLLVTNLVSEQAAIGEQKGVGDEDWVDRAKRITMIEEKIESMGDHMIEMMNEMMRMMAMGFEKLDLRKEDQTGKKDRREAGPITSGSYAMDQVMDQSQQCMRKLTPLVVEQQPERNTETF